MELKSKQLLLETTNVCDAHCIICPREQFTQKPRFMDMDLFRKIIDDAAQYDIESLDACGFGECFLDKNLFERFAYVRGKLPGASIFVSTTAYHMTPDKYKLVARYIDTLKLSIYGASQAVYEAFHRGRVQYPETMRNILGFLGYTKHLQNKPYTIGLFVETDLNRAEREEWIETWKPRLDEVFVWAPHNWIDGRAYRAVDKTRQQTCGRPDNAPMYIHADGTVSPCCWDIHKRIRLGDMNTQTIEQVYRGAPYRKLREAHRMGDFSEYPYKECDQLNLTKSVLLYKSNNSREVGQITSNQKTIHGS